MTKEEFQTAIREIFPGHDGDAYPVDISGEWHTRIGLFGEVLFVEWIPNARRGMRWQVRANGVVCSSGTLKAAIEDMLKAQIRIANSAGNVVLMIRWAKKP